MERRVVLKKNEEEGRKPKGNAITEEKNVIN